MVANVGTLRRFLKKNDFKVPVIILKKNTLMELELILERACKFFELRPKQIKGKTRIIKIALPRHVIATYLYNLSKNVTTTMVGELLGRDHSSITHSRRIVSEQKELTKKLHELELYMAFINNPEEIEGILKRTEIFRKNMQFKRLIEKLTDENEIVKKKEKEAKKVIKCYLLTDDLQKDYSTFMTQITQIFYPELKSISNFEARKYFSNHEKK